MSEPAKGRPPTSGQSSAFIPLPDNLSDPAGQASAVFDRIAPLYARSRPGYPPEAVNDLRHGCDIRQSSRVLEVGCGTGQLTRDLAGTGARIHCVEAGVSLAELARGELAGSSNVEVTTGSFEDFDDRPGSYDAVVSATAFHWIDPNVSFGKAHTLLRPGGHLALLSNAHSAGGSHTAPGFSDGVRDLHRRLAPEVGDWTFPTAQEIRDRATGGGDIAAVWARVERRLWEPPPVSGLFGEPAVETYPWIARYDPDGYLAMLATQSTYALMEPPRREELLTGIGRLIDERLGDVVTKEYVTILAVARTAR